MGLGTDRKWGIRRILNTLGPNPEAESTGIRDDLGAAVFASGTQTPTAAEDKWPGRAFWHTTELTWYVCDGTNWLPVGGQRTIALGTFGTLASGYVYDTAGGASYVYRAGKRVDVRLRVRKSSGVLVHGEPVLTTTAAYRPAGIGPWPFAALQSGGGAAANAVAAVLNESGTVAPLSPSGVSVVLELSGSYYLP